MHGLQPELRQLRYFLAVAQERSFTRAATRLSMAQPPLSQQIAALEQLLGSRLFVRTTRGVELTDAARALLPRAEAVLRAVDDAVREVRDVAAGTSGTLRIAAVPSAGAGILTAGFREFHAVHDFVALDLRETPYPEAALDLLQDGHVDLAVTRGALPRAGIDTVTLIEEPLVLIVPLQHRLAEAREVSLSELADEPFVIFDVDSPSSTHATIVSACARAGFLPRVVCDGPGFLTVVRLVQSGVGIALLPLSTAQLLSPLSAVAQIPLAAPPPTTVLALSRCIGRPLPAVAQRFLELLMSMTEQDRPEAAAATI